jgi:rod shape determining protein RodA
MFKYLAERFDFRIFLFVIALVALGIVSVYSASFDAKASEIYYKQLLWAAIGMGALFVCAFLPYRLLYLSAYPAYALSIALLIGVLLFGKTVSGSTSWFNLGALRFQPSEFAKVTTVLALAAYLSRPDVTLAKVKHLLAVAGIVLLPVALIMTQPDTGTAVIYIVMLFPVLYWGGAGKFTLLAIVAPGIVAVAALLGITPFFIAVIGLGTLLYLTREHRIVTAVVFSLMVLVGISTQSIYEGLRPYQQKRIAAFLDPNVDPLGAGYNVVQSKVAIGSGGLLGKGYLQGTQTQLNFIPEQWTDFIFCVPGEEFGFLGAATVLVFFALLLLRSIAIGTMVKSSFASFVAIGICGVIGAHVLINIGMSLGLLPVIGIPLPFLSYGGSALLSGMMMMGILMNLYANRKEH